MTPVGRLLAETDLSITALARLAGVSRASVSEYVHGHRQPSVGQLQRLAAAAGRRAEITFPPDLEALRAELADVLALADALPLRRLPAATRTWAELTGLTAR